MIKKITMLKDNSVTILIEYIATIQQSQNLRTRISIIKQLILCIIAC